MSTRGKPSGLAWAPAIPNGWDSAKVCLVARLESGHTPSRQHPEYWVSEDCTIPWFSLADVWQLREANQKYLGDTAERISPLGLANSAARVLPAGTVVLSRTASVGFAGIMPRPMATTQDFANWVCGPRVIPEYLLWAFRAMKPEFARLMMGSTHQTIYMPDIRRLAIPVPPVSEQRAIADFLDRKTAAVDALIERKQQVLTLLDERRLATIAHAVSKGVSPAAGMKPSGHEWLGSIPAHWTVERIKYVAKMESGHTPDKSQPDYWLDSNDIPWVSLNDTRWLSDNDYIADTALHVNERGLANSSAHMLPARVVVFTRDATIGKAAITTRPMAVSQHIIAWVCGPRIHPEYLLYVFYAMEQELIRFTMGATLRTIGMADVKQLVTPVPPLAEQKDVAEFLATATAHILATRTNVERQLDRLREYRQALITAAVTGQLEIAAQEAA